MNDIRQQFPSLRRLVSGQPLVYFDNTATSQTPVRVTDEIIRLYENTKANVHRGVHTMSQEATELQEATRRKTARYINAPSEECIVFTRGTTEAINLVANSFGSMIKDGSEIILTVMEHHSNIVPWQLLAERRNLTIKVVDIDNEGRLDIEQFRNLFSEKTALVSFCHVSNVLGTVNPVREMTAYAHSRGAVVMIDGAQASPHMKIDVTDIDCDFYAFSSHKMYGPTGVGVLYGRKELLDKMPPWQGGGEMISRVSFKKTTYADIPFRFEAGTPDFIGIAAFSKALEFIEETGIDRIGAHDALLLNKATEMLKTVDGIRIYGTAPEKSAVISFLADGIHPYDLGMILDKMGIAVRTGHHCAQPLMDRLGIPGTVRASFAVYNTEEEIERFISALRRSIALFR